MLFHLQNFGKQLLVFIDSYTGKNPHKTNIKSDMG